MAGLTDLLDGVGDGNDRDCGTRRGCSIDRPRDQGLARKRPGSIMDEHDVRSETRKGLKAGTDRRLAGRAAVHRTLVPHRAHRFIEDRDIVRINDGLHSREHRVIAKRLHRARNDGPAGNRTVLLRAARAGA